MSETHNQKLLPFMTECHKCGGEGGIKYGNTIIGICLHCYGSGQERIKEINFALEDCRQKTFAKVVSTI